MVRNTPNKNGPPGVVCARNSVSRLGEREYTLAILQSIHASFDWNNLDPITLVTVLGELEVDIANRRFRS